MSESESVSFEEEDKSLNSDDFEKMKIKLEQNDTNIRVDQEYKIAKSDKHLSSLGCSVGRDENNKFLINATIIGPKNTPFYGGFYKLKIEFPSNYPKSSPKIYFVTKIFHPNVYSDGKICIDVINNWDSNYSIIDILDAVYILLLYPNEDSAANYEAEKMIKEDKKYEKEGKANPHNYEKRAREWNSQYAYPI